MCSLIRGVHYERFHCSDEMQRGDHNADVVGAVKTTHV